MDMKKQKLAIKRVQPLLRTFGLARREHRVNFIDEDDAGLQAAGNGKQSAHHLLTLSNPLGRQGRGRYGEEGRAAHGTHYFENYEACS